MKQIAEDNVIVENRKMIKNVIIESDKTSQEDANDQACSKEEVKSD